MSLFVSSQAANFVQMFFLQRDPHEYTRFKLQSKRETTKTLLSSFTEEKIKRDDDNNFLFTVPFNIYRVENVDRTLEILVQPF